MPVPTRREKQVYGCENSINRNPDAFPVLKMQPIHSGHQTAATSDFLLTTNSRRLLLTVELFKQFVMHRMVEAEPGTLVTLSFFAHLLAAVFIKFPQQADLLRRLRNLKKKHATHRLPHFLPDGKQILFYLGDMNLPMHLSEKTGIYCFDLDTKKITPVLLEETEALYVEPGFLTFVRNGDLMVHRFDPKNLKIEGQAMSIAQGVKFYVERYTGLTPSREIRLFTRAMMNFPCTVDMVRCGWE